MEYSKALVDFYKQVRTDEKEKERRLRDKYVDAIPLKTIEKIESLGCIDTASSNYE